MGIGVLYKSNRMLSVPKVPKSMFFLCSFMVISYVSVILLFDKPISLRNYVVRPNRENIRHHHFFKQNRSSLDVSQPHPDAFTNSNTKVQWLIKNNVDAVVFSAYPKLLSKRAYPKKFKCPETDRTITFRRSPWNVTGLKGADVIIVGCEVADITWKKVREIWDPHQVWVYTTGESAYYSPQVRPTKGVKPLGFGEGFRFNMSFMYHSDSEIVAPYGTYIPFAKNGEKNIEKLTPKSPNYTVAWVSSHCDKTFWDRTGFVRMLSKYIPVDRYGACGNKRITFGMEGINKLRKYKFLLAYENSCCDEYISEKFWKSLAVFQVVPIVIGASKLDYERVAPPHSFVFTNDFDSVEDLASYIRRVASNETLYNEYHEWRKHGRAIELLGKKRIYPFTSTYSACTLLNFLEQHALHASDPPMSMKLDPFGPDWLGTCQPCGEKDWIKRYDLSSDGFDPIVHSHTTFYKFSDMNRTPYRGHAEKVYNLLRNQSSHQ